MSRIGNKIVVLPAGVEVKQDGHDITVKGPKGELTRTFSSDIEMNIEGNEVTFTRPNDIKEMKTIDGTTPCQLQQHGGRCFRRFPKSVGTSRGRLSCPTAR